MCNHLVAKSARTVITPDVESRFWMKVNKTGKCWEWTGKIDLEGYGSFQIRGKSYRAHRLSAEMAGLPVSRILVLHECDNRKCVNPDHLTLGTQLQNIRDAVSRGRIRTKLRYEDAAQIRSRYSEGRVTQRALSIEYGVTTSTIAKILKSETYRQR